MHTCSLTLVEMHLGDKKLKWTSFRSYTVTPVCPVTKPTTLWHVFFFSLHKVLIWPSLLFFSYTITRPSKILLMFQTMHQQHRTTESHKQYWRTITKAYSLSNLCWQRQLHQCSFFFTLQHFKQNLTSKLSVWEKHVTALTKLFCSSTRGRAGQRQQQASHGSFSITKTSIATSSKPIALLNNICSARYATKSSFVSARKRSSGLQLVGSRIARHSRALPHQEVPASFADISNANLSVAFQAMRKSLNLPQ